MREDTAQMKVSIPIGDLWKAMAIDIGQTATTVLPDIVKEVELLDGDGRLGTILVFKFHPAVPKSKYQKEKIVEFDESRHQIALEILEGGHLDHGFSSYTTGFMLTAVGEADTLIDIKVLYETKPERIHVPGETIKATFHYIKCLENHLSNVIS
ncbi:phytohormone-binding protein-like [Cynara cardunculus var. scolymus]|uniref:phytohormone-binding protein-like n=1 Tax=Cynara cardunculus var. scolymus TaxID=59895 RepID=UPI000D62AC73|nr:phytohormone-binding protein-like [Cynara cardunculus var. scolymus]